MKAPGEFRPSGRCRRACVLIGIVGARAASTLHERVARKPLSAAHTRSEFSTAVGAQNTVIATAFDAMPFAMTCRTLAPVSIVAGTVKVVEPDVPGAIDMVL